MLHYALEQSCNVKQMCNYGLTYEQHCCFRTGGFPQGFPFWVGHKKLGVTTIVQWSSCYDIK